MRESLAHGHLGTLLEIVWATATTRTEEWRLRSRKPLSPTSAALAFGTVYDPLMTLSELAEGLPWGLHDAYLEALSIDWPRATASLTMRLMISERQDHERRARIDLAGLVFCSVEAPEIAPERGYTPTPADGLWLSNGEGSARGAEAVLPAIPEGCFLHWFFVKDWNRFIHVCARDASLMWLDSGPVAARGATRALFPGDEIPDA